MIERVSIGYQDLVATLARVIKKPFWFPIYRVCTWPRHNQSIHNVSSRPIGPLRYAWGQLYCIYMGAEFSVYYSFRFLWYTRGRIINDVA
jgi:hypothetical protein